MNGRPYLIPSKGIDAPSISKTNYGEKLGAGIKKTAVALAKGHAADVKERKAKAVKHAKAVEFLAGQDARAEMERSGKADPQYKSSNIQERQTKAKAGIAKIASTEFPSSHIGASKYAAAQKAAKTVRGKLSAEAPEPHLQGRSGPQTSVRTAYKRTSKRVQADAGAPANRKPTRQVQGSGNSTRSVQFRSL